MPRLVVEVIGALENDGSEVVLAGLESHHYDPMTLDDLVRRVLSQMYAKKGVPEFTSIAGVKDLEVSASLSSAEEDQRTRP